MDYLKRANELYNDTVENRRYIHQNAESGLDLVNTRSYIKKKLIEYGIEPVDCGYGITATIGKGDKTIMLRADMDALVMDEDSGESFACTNGNAHACGHDLHSAMLLTAGRMLKENEDHLSGKVKLMFQPGEEIFKGCENMLDNGLLDDQVDAAIAYHIASGLPVGLFMYNSDGLLMNSVDMFKIYIEGKGSHGACPEQSIDPINIGCHIYLSLQELIAREAKPDQSCVLTIGEFQAGTAPNIIPERVVLSGSIRTNNENERSKLVRRLEEVVKLQSEVFNGKARVEWLSNVPALVCDGELIKEVAGYMKEITPEATGYDHITATASEDFALLSEIIPVSYMYIGAGFSDGRKQYDLHNPKVTMNEEVLPIGSAYMAHCASRWLEMHK